MPQTPCKFTSIGDCCADIYLPEHRVVLGGTAFNVATAATQADAQTSIVSAVGTDDIGHQFQTALATAKIGTDHLHIINGPTSYLHIHLTAQGHPRYSAWHLEALAPWVTTQLDREFLATQDIVHAILYQPLSPIFTQFTQLSLPQTLKVGDFSSDSIYCAPLSEMANYVAGLDIVVKSIQPHDHASLEYLRELATTFQVMVLVLMGEAGSVVFDQGQTYTQPVTAINATNTTGAGDTFIAWFTTHYWSSRQIPESLRVATTAVQKMLR